VRNIPAGGEAVQIAFDQDTTELDALQRAAYAVADQMTVEIRATSTDYVCTLFARESGADPQALKHRIRSEVIDQTLRLRIARETDPLRNLIFALAFSRTGLTEADPADSDHDDAVEDGPEDWDG
jgi:His-Xaa-Ser system protein HxsD